MPPIPVRARLETVIGEPVVAGNVTITPVCRAVSVRFPFGGLAWSAPIAVLVRAGDQTWRVPIVDLNRIVQLGAIGLSLAFLAVGVAGSRRRA